MKIYISVPISGLCLMTQTDIALKIAKKIKDLGHEPVNPFDTPEAPKEYNSTQAYAYYMGRDVERLLLCNAILMCDGCESENKLNKFIESLN